MKTILSLLLATLAYAGTGHAKQYDIDETRETAKIKVLAVKLVKESDNKLTLQVKIQFPNPCEAEKNHNFQYSRELLSDRTEFTLTDSYTPFLGCSDESKSETELLLIHTEFFSDEIQNIYLNGVRAREG